MLGLPSVFHPVQVLIGATSVIQYFFDRVTDVVTIKGYLPVSLNPRTPGTGQSSINISRLGYKAWHAA
jgi:hypothetical protein